MWTGRIARTKSSAVRQPRSTMSIQEVFGPSFRRSRRSRWRNRERSAWRRQCNCKNNPLPAAVVVPGEREQYYPSSPRQPHAPSLLEGSSDTEPDAELLYKDSTDWSPVATRWTPGAYPARENTRNRTSQLSACQNRTTAFEL